MTPELKAKLKRRLPIVIFAVLAIAIIYFTAVLIYKGNMSRKYPAKYIDRGAVTVAERFRVPEGYARNDIAGNVNGQALKKFGLAAYFANGARNFDAGLWGVYADAVAVLPDSFGPFDRNSPEPGTVLKVSRTGAEDDNAKHYLIADLCVDSEGSVLVLLAVFEPGCEVYITVPAETGAEKYAGCWFDLGRSFPEADGWKLEVGGGSTENVWNWY